MKTQPALSSVQELVAWGLSGRKSLHRHEQVADTLPASGLPWFIHAGQLSRLWRQTISCKFLTLLQDNKMYLKWQRTMWITYWKATLVSVYVCTLYKKYESVSYTTSWNHVLVTLENMLWFKVNEVLCMNSEKQVGIEGFFCLLCYICSSCD
jgi:hypothetical protein